MPQHEHDPALDNLLRQWQVKAELPPRFQERVWRRIALEEAQSAARSPVADWLGWVQGFLARPGLATGYVAVFLVAGFTLGWARGLEKSASVQRALSSRYVQAVDPYQGSHVVP